jgi:hypothetical protein
MTGILASATVDVLRPATPKKQGLFKVKVWGVAPHDYTRYYEIEARNDNIAAQQGINRFVAEISKLNGQGT